jgi:inositol polyphosphate 5-phosphatase INPP5B/F
MAESLELSIRNLLRSSEELKVLLEVETISSPSSSSPSSSSSSSDEGQIHNAPHSELSMIAGDSRKRVLAVVSHIDSYGEEQGW